MYYITWNFYDTGGKPSHHPWAGCQYLAWESSGHLGTAHGDVVRHFYPPEIPWTVEEIHNSAFGYNNTCLTLCGASDSVAEEYARKNNLRFQTYDGRWFAPVTKREPPITTNDIHAGNSAGGCDCVGGAVYFLITVSLIIAFSVVWEICLALIWMTATISSVC